MLCCAEDVQAINKLHTKKYSRRFDFILLIVSPGRVLEIMVLVNAINQGRDRKIGELTVDAN